LLIYLAIKDISRSSWKDIKFGKNGFFTDRNTI
jgi:hypothetical protein